MRRPESRVKLDDRHKGQRHGKRPGHFALHHVEDFLGRAVAQLAHIDRRLLAACGRSWRRRHLFFGGAATRVGLALFRPLHTFSGMALINLAVAEEALSLSPAERADLARLLIQSLEDDSRTDAEIKDDLAQRLKDLVSGKDSGLTFQEVFGSPP
jgi:putative addiction module component (TIGR02574 family)